MLEALANIYFWMFTNPEITATIGGLFLLGQMARDTIRWLRNRRL